jgi:hypothetical protein
MLSELIDNIMTLMTELLTFQNLFIIKYIIFKIHFKGLIKNFYDSFLEWVLFGNFTMTVLKLTFDVNSKDEKIKVLKYTK